LSPVGDAFYAQFFPARALGCIPLLDRCNRPLFANDTRISPRERHDAELGRSSCSANHVTYAKVFRHVAVDERLQAWFSGVDSQRATHATSTKRWGRIKGSS
jgi:hypothetical protein